MSCKLLLADADQTLLDFNAGEKIAISATFAHFGYPVTEENVAIYHRVNQAQWKKLERGETTQERLRVDRCADFLRETGLAGDAQAMCDEFIRNLGAQHILINGAEAFCKAVAARMPIILVTNGISAIQRQRYAECALRPYLSGMVVSEEVGVSKPDPRMIYAALELAGGVSPQDAMFIGDSVTADIPCANRAGVASVLITHGAPAPEGHGATYTAKTYDEALRCILGAEMVNPS